MSRPSKPSRRRSSAQTVCRAEPLECRILLTGTPELVKDIFPGSSPAGPWQFAEVNGELYFSANDGVAGHELWKSDGTAAGTVLVRDIRPGIATSDPRGLTNVNGTLFFAADDGTSGFELWKSDGTAAGTVLVEDINPTGDALAFPYEFINMNGTLLFAADNGTSGFELWKSDGTAAGTVLVSDINPGLASSYPAAFSNVDGTLYFSARTETIGRELWKSNGTNTVLVSDINPGIADSDLSTFPEDYANLNGTLFFLANDGTTGRELWKSTPSAQLDLYSENFEVDPSADWAANAGPSDHAVDYFFDYSTVGIPSAPNSGGTTRGMKLQANLTSGIFSGFSSSPIGQNFNGDYTVRFDWWADFNGPFPVGGSGSTQLSTFGIGTSGAIAQWPGGTQDSVWFAATGDGNSFSDWRAYSTAAPTSYSDGSTVYAAVGTGNRNSSHPYYAGFGQNTAPSTQLAQYPQQTGTTLIGSSAMEWHDVIIDKSGTTVAWSVDGLRIATIDLSTVTLGGSNIFFGHSDVNASSSLDPNAAALLFTLIDNISVTTEPPGTTVLVQDIVPGPGSSNPLGLTNAYGTLLFWAQTPANGTEPWRSDGTAAGTVLVKDINPGPASGYYTTYFVNVNGTTCFGARTPATGGELWRTDGTAAGTELIKDINPGPDGSSLLEITNVSGTLFINAFDWTHGLEPWQSDGTTAGTVLVHDIHPGISDSYPIGFTDVDGVAFFDAEDGVHGQELWKLNVSMPIANGIWDGGGDGVNWTDPSNWSNNVLPGPEDDVIMNIAANPTIIVGGTQSVRSVNASETVDITGSLSVAMASSFNAAASISGGTVAGAGDSTFNASLTWTGGTMSGTGRTIISGTGTLNATAGGTLTSSRRFDNNGAVSVSATTLELNGGGTSSGAFNITGFGTGVVVFKTSSYTLTSASSFTGNGEADFYDVPHTIGGQFNNLRRIVVLNGAAATFNGNITVDIVAVSAATATLNAPVSAINFVVNSGGNAMLDANLVASGDITVNGTGNISVFANGSRVVRTSALFMNPSASLDLADNALIGDYSATDGSPLTDIKGYLTSGYASGAWNGVGINSSTAAATPNRALGYAESSAIFSNFPATFAGEQVDNTAILVRYTRYGDADLNQTVNLNDFNRLAANFGGTNKVWSEGDFNFDMLVNLSDFNLLAANFGQMASPAMRGTLEPPRIGQSIFNDDSDEEFVS